MPSRIPQRIKAKAPGKRLAGPKTGGLTPRVKEAVELLVFSGLTRPEAAQQAGLTDSGLRQALSKPTVLRYLNEQTEVLRTSTRPRAVQKIAHLMDNASSEKIQFLSAKHFDTQANSLQGGSSINLSVNIAPGYVIDLSEPSQTLDITPNATPAREHEGEGE